MIKMVCKNGHKYDTYPSRIKDGRGCPYCSGQRVCYENSLAEKYPEIAKEWHPTLNGNKTPSGFQSGSAYIAWWQCPKEDEHVYQAALYRRTGKHISGCPECCHSKNANNTINGIAKIHQTFLAECPKYADIVIIIISPNRL